MFLSQTLQSYWKSSNCIVWKNSLEWNGMKNLLFIFFYPYKSGSVHWKPPHVFTVSLLSFLREIFSSSCLFEKPAVFFHLQLSSFGLVTTTAASGAPLGTGPKQLDQEFDRGSLWVTASSELHNALCITALTQLMFCVSSPRNKVYLQLFQVFCVISSQKKKKKHNWELLSGPSKILAINSRRL